MLNDRLDIESEEEVTSQVPGLDNWIYGVVSS